MHALQVMDCGSQVWSTPPVDHGVAPCGREDSAWVFDVKTCSLLIFGGWANRWLGDTIKLNVSPIIGPPYACTEIEPKSGPVFGSTELIVKGLRFKQGAIKVKFGTRCAENGWLGGHMAYGPSTGPASMWQACVNVEDPTTTAAGIVEHSQGTAALVEQTRSCSPHTHFLYRTMWRCC